MVLGLVTDGVVKAIFVEARNTHSFTLKMIASESVETSVTSNLLSQDYDDLEDNYQLVLILLGSSYLH